MYTNDNAFFKTKPESLPPKPPRPKMSASVARALGINHLGKSVAGLLNCLDNDEFLKESSLSKMSYLSSSTLFQKSLASLSIFLLVSSKSLREDEKQESSQKESRNDVGIKDILCKVVVRTKAKNQFVVKIHEDYE